MQKIFAVLICLILFLTSAPISYATDGDPNIDGGGGGTGSGTGANKWTPGDDGVRVTVVRESDNRGITTPIDFSNRDGSSYAFTFPLQPRTKFAILRVTRKTNQN